MQDYHIFWRKNLAFSRKIVGTRHSKGNAVVANIIDAVSLPSPTDFFSKSYEGGDRTSLTSQIKGAIVSTVIQGSDYNKKTS
ncbi:MAG: hypothetical protein U7127_00830 [Phormidium sp.]